MPAAELHPAAFAVHDAGVLQPARLVGDARLHSRQVHARARPRRRQRHNPAPRWGRWRVGDKGRFAGPGLPAAGARPASHCLSIASCLSRLAARSSYPALKLALPPPHPCCCAVAYSGLFTHANYFEESPLYVYAMKASRSASQAPLHCIGVIGWRMVRGTAVHSDCDARPRTLCRRQHLPSSSLLSLAAEHLTRRQAGGMAAGSQQPGT